MYAEDNPETKTIVLGASLLAVAGLAFYWWQSRDSRDSGEAEVQADDPVALVREHLTARGFPTHQLQFRAMQKPQGTMVQVRDAARRRSWTFGVRGGQVKMLQSPEKKPASERAQSQVSEFLASQGHAPGEYKITGEQGSGTVRAWNPETREQLTFVDTGSGLKLYSVHARQTQEEVDQIHDLKKQKAIAEIQQERYRQDKLKEHSSRAAVLKAAGLPL